MTARTLCEQYRKLGTMNGHPLPEVWLLDYGRDFEIRPRPESVEKGIPKACFANALELAGRFNYAEGFVVVPPIPLPIHHAWNVDPDGYVIDSTLDDGGSYFGVEIPDLGALYALVRETHSYGVLYKRVGHELIEAL